MEDIASIELVIRNEKGLHARPASMVAKKIAEFDADVTLSNGRQKADGRSVLSILMLAATQGTILLGQATGRERKEALEALKLLFENEFSQD